MLTNFVNFECFLTKLSAIDSCEQRINIHFLLPVGMHNGENDSHKRQFLPLGVCSQSWKLNSLSKKNLVKVVLQGACYNLTEKRNVDCKVSNLRIKIADKRGQLALIS